MEDRLSTAFGILMRVCARTGGLGRSSVSMIGDFPFSASSEYVSFEHERPPPRQLHPGRHIVVRDWAGGCWGKRDFVAERRRAMQGQAKAKRIWSGKGDGDESISRSQISGS